MYRLVKFEKCAFDHVVPGFKLSYRQIQVTRFLQLSAALTACEAANDKVGDHHYILNASGKEYYGGTWVD